MVKTVVPIFTEEYPEAQLCDTYASNTLAVSIGDGSSYDKHYDNCGMEDRRKLTILYYMNHKWKDEYGGEFRIYPSVTNTEYTHTGTGNTDKVEAKSQSQSLLLSEEGSGLEYIDIAPVADRLLVFWSDKLIHRVNPNYAPSTTTTTTDDSNIDIDSDTQSCQKATVQDAHRYALTLWISAVTTDAISPPPEEGAEEVEEEFELTDEELDEMLKSGPWN